VGKITQAKREKRANPPVCCICDKRLYGGGWFYSDVWDVNAKAVRPSHTSCKPDGLLYETYSAQS
jgi:hypothetical protein